jgi:hypothetical protein
MSASALVQSARLVLERDLVAPLLSPFIFGRLHQNVDGILESHKDLMQNLLEFVTAEGRREIHPDVYDVLGVEPPDSESESNSDHGTYSHYSSSSEDFF